MAKIKEFKEKERYTMNLLVKSVVKGVTQKGSPYLNLVLQDNTGTIDGKLWDASEADMANARPGHVEKLSFEVLDYNNALQLRVNRITDLDQDLVDLSEYVMTSPVEIEELKARINGYINSITNPTLKALVSGMHEKTGKKFYDYPAASRIHHNYLGGLAEHTLGMADLAETIAGQYPVINRDLLIAGVLVHDVGKTVELGGLVSNEYTLEGKLTGHISIAHGWLMETAEKLGLQEKEETLLLRHMILSHHGRQEFGSPVLPAIPEAEALFLIDNIDAKMNTLKQALATVKPGQWTPRMFSLDNRAFFKADLD
ncbi:MAG: HD domain-containing protein [Solobacterium sp.]|nr:HD domain-containing protein [Solobacterium sp.]